MTPSLTSLGEADSTPGQYVLERTWPGAVGTSWIFTQPLMEIARCWKDIICSPDDKADTFCFHAAQFLTADPPSPPNESTVPVYQKKLPWSTLLLLPVSVFLPPPITSFLMPWLYYRLVA